MCQVQNEMQRNLRVFPDWEMSRGEETRTAFVGGILRFSWLLRSLRSLRSSSLATALSALCSTRTKKKTEKSRTSTLLECTRHQTNYKMLRIHLWEDWQTNNTNRRNRGKHRITLRSVAGPSLNIWPVAMYWKVYENHDALKVLKLVILPRWHLAFKQTW